MIPFKTDFSNKVCVITGGSGVLCFPMAIMLAQNNAKVAILGIDQEKLDSKVLEAKQLNLDVLAINCNVLDKQALEKAKKIINAKLGTIDILINGAGGNHPKGTTDSEFMNLEDINSGIKTFFDLDVEGFKFVMDLNFIGTLLPTQVFSTDMLDKKDASILNISSMNAYTPLTKIPAYSSAKAAISNFTQWLAVHFAHTNIRVNAIAPGFFITEQNKTLLFDENNNPTARSTKILNSTPMNRFGESNELLGTVLYLLDNNCSSFVTGVVIPIDGGFSAYSGV